MVDQETDQNHMDGTTVVFLEIEIKNIKSVTVKRIVNAVVFYYCVYYFFNYLYIYKWEEMRTW